MELLLIIIILILLGWFWPIVGFLTFVLVGIIILCLLAVAMEGLSSFFGALFSNKKKHKNALTEGYCVKCKTKREIKDAKEIEMRGRGDNPRMGMTGTCPVCGTKMFRFKKVKPDNNTNNLTVTESFPDYDRLTKYELPDEEADDEIKNLMESHAIDKDEAEHIKEIMDDHGLDEDEAVELKDEL